MLLLVILLITLGCDNTSPICDQTYTLNSEDKCLWNETVKPYLEDPLWTESDIYDAGHFLMVPLHAAFLNNQELWQNQFAQHFQRFVKGSVVKKWKCPSQCAKFYRRSGKIISEKEI